MKLYTSYWAQVRNFPKTLVGLNTTIWPPKWRSLGQDNRGVICLDCPPLKPGTACEGLCQGKCKPIHPFDCQFLQVYKQQLNKISFNDFINHLQLLADTIKMGEQLEEINFAFLFFEPPHKVCSERWPVQEWFKNNGREIEEWHK